MIRAVTGCAILFLWACAEPKSPKTGGEFSTAQLTLFAQRVSECSGRDQEAILSIFQLPDLATRVDHALKQKRITYDREQAAKCLDTLRTAECKALGESFKLGGECDLSFVGQVKLGDDCFEVEGNFNECADGHFCVPSSECAGICTAVVASGGACGAGTLCAPDTHCLAGVCRKDADVGTTCAGNTGVLCRDTLACIYGDSTMTGTCSEPLTEGRCRFTNEGGDAGDCLIGSHCQITDQAESFCSRSLTAGEACKPGRNACATFHACVPDAGGNFVCTKYAHEGETCGSYASFEGQFLFEDLGCIDSWCGVDFSTLPEDAVDFVGTCQPLVAIDGECQSSGQCTAGASCNSFSGTCVAGCPLQ